MSNTQPTEEAVVATQGVSHSSSHKSRSWLTVAFVSVIVFNVASGWWMPDFYDWTGADQSRPAPIVSWVAIGMLLFNILTIGVLGWAHITKKWPSRAPSGGMQFSILHIFFVMTVVAAFLALSRGASLEIAFYVLHGVVWITCIGISIRYRPLRRWLVLLFACQSAPYLWILKAGSAMPSVVGFLLLMTSLPAFLPSMVISALTGRHFEKLQWLATMLTMFELVIGVWLILLGTKRAIAYCLIVSTLSLFGSFLLHALMRA